MLVTVELRSTYLMRGAARWNYQHSIPAVKTLRYSIISSPPADSTLVPS